MNALVLENNGDRQRTPRMSDCEPSRAILPPRVGQRPWRVFRAEIRRFAKDERKAGESPGAFRAPGRELLPAVRAVAGTGADAFLAGERTD